MPIQKWLGFSWVEIDDFGERHEVRTINDMQWLGKKNGELIKSKYIPLRAFEKVRFESGVMTVGRSLYTCL